MSSTDTDEFRIVEMCACGKPLHYTDSGLRELITLMCKEKGEFITVRTESATYKVQRHFIALHGIKATDLPELLKQGLVQLAEKK